MNISSVLKEVLVDISISKEQERDFFNKAKEIIEKLKVHKLDVFIGGSLAKGTLVKKEKQDIDLFVVFDKEEDTRKLEEILSKSGINVKKIHGSRDYFHIEHDDCIIELIPVVKISKPEQAENVSDVSLMHVGYVKNRISKKKNLGDEIKFAKTFCFANECYGAESYIGGFSGYALEVLVIYFGGFIKFLKGIQKKRVIDPEKYFKNEREIKRELNESKLNSPVILVDPTYRYRNVCAGLSEETFELFLNASKKFLKSPSLRYFEKERFDIDKFRKDAAKKKAEFVKLRIETDKQEGDIAGTKMKKFFRFIIQELERKEQKVVLSKFVYSGGKSAECYFAVKENKEIEIQGPPVKMKESVKKFKLIRKKTYVKKKFVYAKEKVSLKDIFSKLKRFEDEMSVWSEVIEY